MLKLFEKFFCKGCRYKENVIIELSEGGVELRKLLYSQQAFVLIENMKGFDRKDFEKWFIEKMVVGSNTILEYLIDKKRQNSKLIIKPKEVGKYGK